VAAQVRDAGGGTDPDRYVSRRRVVAIGLAVCVVYLLGAALSGHLDPLDRRPLLDGLAPPPAYEWVDPPAALASTNTPPQAKTFPLTPETATYDPATGSGAGVFASGNYQANLALSAGAIAPVHGATQVILTMRPLAPVQGAVIPDGYGIAGNVIQITAAYRPAGGTVTDLAGDAQLTLAYPLVYFGIDDTLLRSSDGTTWEAVKSTDHLSQQVVIGDIDRLGFYAVGQTAGTERQPSSGAAGGSRSILVYVVGGLLFVSVFAAVGALWRSRGSETTEPPEKRRPPPRDDDPFDPWKS
jgi:hypothetical protein